MNVEKILEEKSRLIDKELENAFPRCMVKEFPNLYDAIWYHLETGGKRLRPVLAIMTCDALEGDTEKIIPFATACEIMHNWFLIHDDIEDGDIVRRNKPAVWAKYGLAYGINAGDYMAHKVFETVLRSRDVGLDDDITFRLVSLIVETALKSSEGQTLDMNMRKQDNPKESDYMEMVAMKTGHYFTIPMIGGAIVAGADDTILNTILEFGKIAGPAFQISDDLLDLSEGKGRKEIGRDIKEGKRSILVIHCLLNCSRDERKELLEILDNPVDQTTDEDVAKVKALFEKYDSIAYATAKAYELVEESKKTARTLPLRLAELLEFFADYLIERKK
jgi:geranylgeranyl pyrophosphate synthase